MAKLVALAVGALFVVAILALFIVLPLMDRFSERRGGDTRYDPPSRE